VHKYNFVEQQEWGSREVMWGGGGGAVRTPELRNVSKEIWFITHNSGMYIPLMSIISKSVRAMAVFM
jgi:hypothetical protein